VPTEGTTRQEAWRTSLESKEQMGKGRLLRQQRDSPDARKEKKPNLISVKLRLRSPYQSHSPSARLRHLWVRRVRLQCYSLPHSKHRIQVNDIPKRRYALSSPYRRACRLVRKASWPSPSGSPVVSTTSCRSRFMILCEVVLGDLGGEGLPPPLLLPAYKARVSW
jgi:hypothetical protein